MITEIELNNYRGFDKHTVPLRQVSVIVGRNNSGKSTIVEALNLVSLVLSRAQYLRYTQPPEWLDGPAARIGISPSLRGYEFEFRNLCHQYQEPPSAIHAKFEDKSSIDIYLNPEEEEIFAVLRDSKRQVITSKSRAQRLTSNIINVLPPVGRLNVRERVLHADYVRSNLNANLAPMHFRNQLYYYGDTPVESAEYGTEYDESNLTRFEAFSRIAEFTWPHLRINELEPSDATAPTREAELNLLVRDGPYVAEVGWVGQGLQAWLQTCWFLARCSKLSTVVLDEPDVYLHADIQRKLIRIVKDHYSQIIIATHSIEILSEIDPENILIVDRGSKKSHFAETLPAVQSVINNVGSVNNLQLTRLWAAKRCLFVEGNDLLFISAFHDITHPTSEISIGALPNLSVGGFGNWRLAVGASLGIQKAGDSSIRAYCILDNDYRTEQENKAVKKTAADSGLEVHIWSRKEIENYVLVPSAIARYIARRSQKGAPSEKEVNTAIEKILEKVKEDVFDQISDRIQKVEKNGGVNANKKARKIVDEAWKSFDGKASICPGKKIVSTLSSWSQEKYNVSFGALSLARTMLDNEIASEMKFVIDALEKSTPLQT